VDEADYWVSLEYRICRELAGMAAKPLRCLWCDGLIPDLYLLDAGMPRITGRAWIGNGPRQQDEWMFTLMLPGPVGLRAEIDWASLLPPENVTRWISLDGVSRSITVEPAAAVLD
jgi:hypothetical protein